MAERLDLQQDLYATGSPSAPLGALDSLFVPGSMYGGYDGKNLREQTGVAETLRDGSAQLGIGAWDGLFGESGEVLDAGSLLRSLNAASFLGADPISLRDSSRLYGYGNPEQSQNPYFDLFPQMRPRVFNTPGGAANAPYNQLRDQGYDSGLLNWAQGFNDKNAGWDDMREHLWDPNNLRFGNTDIGGIDLAAEGMTLGQLDAWAQENHGTDLLGLAGLSKEMAAGRDEWRNDTSLWFDPKNPGQISATGVPGYSDKDSADRLAEYSAGYERDQIARGTELNTDIGSVISRAQLANPELMRTGLGQYMMQVLGPLIGGAAAQRSQMTPEPTNYDFLFQYGDTPRQTRSALDQVRAQF